MTGAGPVIDHPRIATGQVGRRDYQVAIAHEALQRDTLVILPTGMGKTVVALLVMADRLISHPGKVLLLAPTKPLVEQHARFLDNVLLESNVVVFTGETPPADRELAFREADIICSTPQVVQNDLVGGRIDLKDTTLVIFDEAHRATGNYAYVFINETYRRQRLDARVLAMTASPGSSIDKIRYVCENLGIESVEVRTEWDDDTAPYVQDTKIDWKEVAVPPTLKRVSELLKAIESDHVQAVVAAGGLPANARFVGRKTLLDAQRRLQQRTRDGDADTLVWQGLSAVAAAMKVGHALEMAETQGVQALTSYLDKLASDESKAAKRLLADHRMDEVQQLLKDSRVEHPKLRQVAILVRQQLARDAASKILVFTNFRDTAVALTDQLAQVEGIRPARFVGQANKSEADKGMSQKKQAEMVQRFKDGELNVLVATSVAEEGLDIPATDLVIFFEPVASEIRAIQRRGRTGRQSEGRVVVLITKDTRDETYHWASRAREKKMRKEIDGLRRHFKHVNSSTSGDDWRDAFTAASRPEPRPLDSFESAADQAARQDEGARIEIVADSRELNGPVARELARLDIIVRTERLDVSDYVLSDRVAIERKSAEDFATSLIDGRLFDQARHLRDAYTAPIIIIEGDGLMTARRINEDAIYAAIASLSADYHITILTSKDAAETARLMSHIAKREQRDRKKAIAIRPKQEGAMHDDERLRYLVEGLPNISAVLAQRLLDHFGTVRDLANASIDELQQVDGVGHVKAQAIFDILRTPYIGRGKR